MAQNGPIRDQRRQELIGATIAVIARHGYAGTTLARVAEEAGVAAGLVNFHFQSKERLFRETFAHLSAEYEGIWQRRLAATSAEPRARLAAMIEAYFDRRIFTREKLAAWFTFWSDAALRDRYRAAATRVERRYLAQMETEIAALAADGGTAQASGVTTALSAMIDGFWLQALIYPRQFKRGEAIATCRRFLADKLGA
jgi:TetR/AcrR family transcriptional regulator, transcriptional repressor of bet genes